MNDPGSQYRSRLDFWENAVRRYDTHHKRLGIIKLSLTATILIVCWIYRASTLELLACAAILILFLIAANVAHSRVLGHLHRARRTVEFYRRGIARIAGEWAGVGDRGERYIGSRHLYARDLDILGDGSLYQLLCTCRTRMGKTALANALLAPASLPLILERQAAIAELRDNRINMPLREDLASAGDSEAIECDAARLAEWAAQSPQFNYRRWRPVAMGLAIASIAALVYAFLAGLGIDGRPGLAPPFLGGWLPFLNLLAVDLLVNFFLRHPRRAILERFGPAARDLQSLGELIERLEQSSFQSEPLRRLQARLHGGGIRTSRAIAKLGTIAEFEHSRDNWFVRLLDQPLMYATQVACALEEWRGRYGDSVTAWLDAVAEFELLMALAAYSFENPADPFPQFLPDTRGASFVGSSLGHPLAGSANFVRNDVQLDAGNRILLVSGSNMSGKSTFLRTVGVNAVLAMMGAPVRAEVLQLTPLAIGASLQISDSLQQGVSHFYAEIARVKEIVELAARGPVLFLLDEVLQGTNSADRRAGTEGILRTLLHRNATGLVTTHDLALTAIAQLFPEQIRNFHFEDRFTAGELSFDFRIRPGPAGAGNGVELMRSMGLDV